MDRLNRRAIVSIALVLEAALFCCYLVWFYWRSKAGFPGIEGVQTALRAFFAALALLAANLVLFDWAAPRTPRLNQLVRFKQEYIVPLAVLLGPAEALAVSVAAGIGEEFFFRGALQVEFGIVLSSLLFAVVHFGPAARQYFGVLTIYFAVSIYFGLLYQLTGDLWATAAAHGLYDFLALVIIRRQHAAGI